MGSVVRADRGDGIWVRVQDCWDGSYSGLGVLCRDAVPVCGQRPAGVYLSLSTAAIAGTGGTGGNSGSGVKTPSFYIALRKESVFALSSRMPAPDGYYFGISCGSAGYTKTR